MFDVEEKAVLHIAIEMCSPNQNKGVGIYDSQGIPKYLLHTSEG